MENGVHPDLPRRRTALSRRAFLKFCALTASLLALPAGTAQLMAEALSRARRMPVIWLSFQECTGCTESLTRSSAPSIDRLLFELISLDYHHTLQAASGVAAEAARERTLKEHAGRLLLIVDGSVPTALNGACSTIAGESNLSLLERSVAAAEASRCSRHLRGLRRSACRCTESHRRTECR
jgi:hydrogenase small subunit